MKQPVASLQVKQLLLGDCCEKRFEKNGEDWILKNYFKDNQFPILENLLAMSPVFEKTDAKYYDLRKGTEVDIEKMVYFATSVFWRSAVRSWPFPASPPYGPIKLGPYLEELRLFLLGQSAFPDNASLGIFISPRPRHDGVIFPQRANRAGGPFIRHGFFVPGIAFVLCLGKKIPDTIKNECAFKKKLLILSMQGENLAINMRAKLASR